MTNKQILKKINSQLKKISPKARKLVSDFSTGIPAIGFSIEILNREVN